MPSLKHEVDMICSRVVSRKHYMASLMLGLKEVEIKAEDIPVHMNQGQTATKLPKDKSETTVIVHAG